MTMTEEPTTTRGNGRRTTESDGAALSDQLVLSSAGLVSQGIGSARRLADGAIATVDTIVAGGFDLADQLLASTVATDLASKGLAVARQAWSLGVGTARSSLGDL